jgi:hypothetical protein
MEAIAKVNITPQILAQAFWAMCSVEQVEFFGELYFVILEDHKTNKNAYGQGELQWFHTAEELLKNENKTARSMLMTMAAPLYLHTLRHVSL